MRRNRTRKVLVLNCGSSSVKFKLFEMPSERLLLEGNRKRGPEQSFGDMLDSIFDLAGQDVDIMAHRVVHGADLFPESVLITEKEMSRVESVSYLAPLHNPINLEGIRLSRTRYPTIPHAAVFDTSFHQTMPPTSYLYSIPYEYYERHKIRKYGFHGQSGLLGISGVSNDIRDLLKLAEEGHERSRLALDLFVSKLHQYIGLYFARLNGADGIIFTAGVGENSPEIRRKICQGLEFAGVYLDPEANVADTGERLISSPYSPTKVMVIPTNEEIVMARDAFELVRLQEVGKPYAGRFAVTN